MVVALELRLLNSLKKKHMGYLSRQYFLWRNFSSFFLYHYLVYKVLSCYLVLSMGKTFSLPYECD